MEKSGMNDKVRKLEEEWAKEEKNEEESLDDALFGMEMLLYTSRSLKIEGNSNVKITEIDKK
jgi:hypothetical protein